MNWGGTLVLSLLAHILPISSFRRRRDHQQYTLYPPPFSSPVFGTRRPTSLKQTPHGPLARSSHASVQWHARRTHKSPLEPLTLDMPQNHTRARHCRQVSRYIRMLDGVNCLPHRKGNATTPGSACVYVSPQERAYMPLSYMRAVRQLLRFSLRTLLR